MKFLVKSPMLIAGEHHSIGRVIEMDAKTQDDLRIIGDLAASGRVEQVDEKTALVSEADLSKKAAK